MSIRPHHVAVIAYDQLCTFEFGVAVEIFGSRRADVDPWYAFKVVSADASPIRAAGGILMTVSEDLDEIRRADSIIVPGWRNVRKRPPERLLSAIQDAHARGARLLSFCSGVFVLAAAGLLENRHATTHWRYVDVLAEMYPGIQIEPNKLYVDGGDILTAAGSAAAIDLSLHVVRNDHGAKVANTVARRLVVPPHREGGQAQFIESPMSEGSVDPISKLLDWLRVRLREQHTIDSMASRVQMSPRTLSRRFLAVTGTSPQRWLLRERVFLAQQLLETTNESIEIIGSDCGLGSAQLLRLHFRRLLGTSPSAYRVSFRGATHGVATS